VTSLPIAAPPVEDGLPFDVAAVCRGVDAFFARLGALGQDAPGVAMPLVPWLLVAGAVALECARRWECRALRNPAEEWALAPGAFPEEE
jgi:hypothetical protein